MDPVKVQAIHDWIQPISVKGLQKFLGFANFYRRFIANFSSVVKPLTDLTKKGADVTNWSSEAVEAFQELKRRFTSAPMLRKPDVSLPFQVEVDASEIGAGAVLSQRESDGSLMKPCAFFSRKFSPVERNYDVGNRELLAMKWAFEEWRHCLEGAKHRVVVLTDHKNLIYLESAKRLNPRQARWSLFFSRFDFVVSYLLGSKNVKADALSRSFSPDSPGILEPVGILKEGVILSAISPDLRRVLQEFQADRPDRCPVGKLFVPDRWTSKVEPSDCPGVDSVVDRLQQIWTHVVDNLTLSQERAQRFANRRRCVGPRLRVGDLVWLSSRHVPMKVSSPKFKPRYIGPYKISEIINLVSFRLALPASFAIHNVFHRSLLRRYVVPVVPSVDPPAPVLVEGELEYEVEKILDSRFSRWRLQYLVKWKGYGQEDNSWVVASDVHATDLVRAFHLARPDRPGGSAYQCELFLSCWKLWEADLPSTPLVRLASAQPVTAWLKQCFQLLTDVLISEMEDEEEEEEMFAHLYVSLCLPTETLPGIMIPSDPITLVLSIILCLFLVLFFFGWKKNAYNLPPGPRPLPIIGNLHILDVKRPYLTMHELSKKYGPVYTLQLGVEKVVVICGYEAVKDALVNHAEEFSGRAKMPLLDDIVKGHGKVHKITRLGDGLNLLYKLISSVKYIVWSGNLQLKIVGP
ncbi:unnamed protein product [Ranitomeya imitator]|uniref:Chromo domain-containing protein n=1 Tax=Ranitomeya imitator TaxID=111125 RepID=A0ABN9M949_9NEOB|nr:unnamed protein product [Ranitomeya imitator]